MASRYRIDWADIDGQREHITGILARNLEEQTPDLFDWRYKNCPSGRALCLLAWDERSGEFVGFGALFPRRLSVVGEPLSACIPGDFAVDPKHRAFGPAFDMQKTIQASLDANGIQFVYGRPNQNSESVFRRIGYREVGSMNRYARILSAKRHVRQRITSPAMSEVVSKSADYFLERVYLDGRFRDRSTFRVERPRVFDDRFDTLWAKVSRQHGVIAERSSAYLNWRYIDSPLGRYKTFCVRTRDGEIQAYLVYTIHDDVCYIEDLITVDPYALDAMLYRFIRYAREHGMASLSISFMGSDSTIRALRRWGFRQRETISTVLAFSNGDCPHADVLYDRNQWHLLEGDNDI